MFSLRFLAYDWTCSLQPVLRSVFFLIFILFWQLFSFQLFIKLPINIYLGLFKWKQFFQPQFFRVDHFVTCYRPQVKTRYLVYLWSQLILLHFYKGWVNAGALDAVRVDEHDYNRLFYVYMIQRPKRVINININE